MNLSVIIPVYNEAKTVGVLLQRVRRVPVEKEIIVVDDGSTDGTRDILKSLFPGDTPDAKVILAPINQGKGSAIRLALEHVHGDIVLIQDADLEYDPVVYPELIKPFSNPQVQVVYGSRFMRTTLRGFLREWYALRFRKKSPERRYLSTYLGIRLLNFLSRLLYGLKITDAATCYKVFRTALLKDIGLESKGFDFCPEVTAKIGRRRIKIVEVPIVYHPRTYQEGKKLKILRDGLVAVWTLLKYRFGKP